LSRRAPYTQRVFDLLEERGPMRKEEILAEIWALVPPGQGWRFQERQRLELARREGRADTARKRARTDEELVRQGCRRKALEALSAQVYYGNLRRAGDVFYLPWQTREYAARALRAAIQMEELTGVGTEPTASPSTEAEQIPARIANSVAHELRDLAHLVGNGFKPEDLPLLSEKLRTIALRMERPDPRMLEVPDWVVARMWREREAGATFVKIAQSLTAEGVPTARGGKWWPTTVRHTMGLTANGGRRAQAERGA